MDGEGDSEKRKRMSCGIYISCPPQIKSALETCFQCGYHFVVTQLTHPNYARELLENPPPAIGRTDRILKGSEWSRLVVGELNKTIDVDSEVEHIREQSKALLLQELGLASHLSIPAVLLTLENPVNTQLARIIYDKILSGYDYGIWVTVPMVHPSRFCPLADEKHESWQWWDDFRTYCHYDNRIGVVLEMPDINHMPTTAEVDRWIGEPVKALVVPASLFLLNQYNKPVLPKAHQELIKRFMTIDVQYIIKSDTEMDITHYQGYLNFLGKKLYTNDTTSEFVQGCEDYLQNPLQPLTEHLEANIYEVFEKDQVKYDTYQNAIYKALETWPKDSKVDPVVMVVGAGRGPLVQAVLNVSYTLHRKVKVYAVEKNPYAVNTLMDRNRNEWNSKVTLVYCDMRTYEPPEKADILVSELLGSFGDNELSPECLDGAQRFLKKTGISIPYIYTSFIAPIQSLKIFTEIKRNRTLDKTLQSIYETPYVVHLANYYQIAPPQELFSFTHPNWSKRINNQRYKKLSFSCSQTCVLTGFAGFFDTFLYEDVNLSIHPETHSPDMVSWFPIVFPLQNPVHVKEGTKIEISFWRAESPDKVWYEWCLESPVKQSIKNPHGRSYFIKKH
ncbi:unnamed protein product [Brassicogethes aeneus]|uniref:Protein arginine N-methyltransferase n=1 Tax=Brassicogethes aeneus TaxID=1431903 RepID=A0A9P0ARA8_BRAAE|nr:unnamed protein product [Brassicogethes aeneus]